MTAKEKIHERLMKLDDELQELDSIIDIDLEEYESKRLEIYVEFANDIENINEKA